jgi:hypothetical protein
MRRAARILQTLRSGILTRTISLVTAVVFSAGLVLTMPLPAQTVTDVEMGGISGPPQAQRSHFTLRIPAAL